MRIVPTVMICVALIGCGPAQNPGPGMKDARDVSGNYTLSYDNQLTLKLDIGGAVRTVTQSGYGGIADFGTYNGQPVTLNLTEFCAKPEVNCPSEAFWAKVAINQPDLKANNFTLQKLSVINDTVHTLPKGQSAASLGGLIDHAQEDRFLLGLGGGSSSNANCLALALSLAGGRFSRVGEHVDMVTRYRFEDGRACTPGDGGVVDAGTTDAGVKLMADGGVFTCTAYQAPQLIIPAGAAVNGIAEGKVALGFTGGCAFGPFIAGATLTMETGYTGVRTGDFDPPPFTPAEVVLPDGGLLDGGAGDAGRSDAGP